MKIKVEYTIADTIFSVTHTDVGHVRIDAHDRLILEKNGKPVAAYRSWTRWEKAISD